ncbi:MAG TPA: DUF3419 family protein [Bacteroidia bacterium]
MKADFSFIRYANCWEDADLMLDELKPLSGNRVLSIASAGDNTFAFLNKNVSEVIGFDINPAQLSLCRLKQAAIANFDRSDVLAFLGFEPSENRIQMFKDLKGDLDDDTFNYFSLHQDKIESGLIHSGKFEHYFSLFRRYVLPLIHNKRKIDELFKIRSASEQKQFYDLKWNTFRWRMLFKLFFSRAVMGRFGRDPSFFDQVETNVGASIFSRAESQLESESISRNHFLDYQLRGRFSVSLPYYLREENFAGIKQNINKVKWVKTDLLGINKTEHFDVINLSNIFEYMNKDVYLQQLDHLKLILKPEARVGHWNLLVNRFPSELDDAFMPLPVKGLDLCFFYSSYNVNVLK